MRFLHTSDWHLGRTIRGISRQPEFEQVLHEVSDIAKNEAVDAVILAGDTFDTFSPPAEAERLLYETLTELLRDGIQIVTIAGNHDHAQRMDALSGIMRMAGAHCIGSVPRDEGYVPLRLASRDGSHETTIVALPWVPERVAVEFDRLFGDVPDALARYAGQMERAIQFFCRAFTPETANVFIGHMMVGGAAIGEGSGERKIHTSWMFTVPPSCLPESAQYVALGHVHKPQEIAHAAPAFYSGSLLQLDFGEAGQQKSVNIVDVKPRLPAQVRTIEITGGRRLRDVQLKLEELHQHADRYGDDYLRVSVELERPMFSLFEQVRDVLPNALEVRPILPESVGTPTVSPNGHRTMSPSELFAQYYASENGGAEIEPALVKLFNELYEAEMQRAPA